MLSGGQRQRVAIGRAMVREPVAYLMDEPLSNLDAKLRVSMRAELARLHHRLGVTTVYVTHDQTEAMTLGDRVCVMLDGVVQQVAPPGALYRSPANAFVANFIGSPSDEPGRREVSTEPLVRLGGLRLDLSDEQRERVGSRDQVVVGLRPADFGHRALDVSPHDDGSAAARGSPAGDAEIVENLGSEQLVVFPVDVPRYQVAPGAVAAATTRPSSRRPRGPASRPGWTCDARCSRGHPSTSGSTSIALYLFDPIDGAALPSAPGAAPAPEAPAPVLAVPSVP